MSRTWQTLNVFRSWNADASVRRPFPEAPASRAGDVWFPNAKVAHLASLLRLPQGSDMLHASRVHALYRYLSFTAHLETAVVNQEIQSIIDGSHAFTIPDEFRADAYKIYVDEAHHAYCAVELIARVAKATGIAMLPGHRPAFLAEIDRLLAEIPQQRRALAHFAFVFVSETLITSTLRLGRDDTLHPLVRTTIADHMADEALHHAYFATLFPVVWRQLSAADRSWLACLAERLVRIYFTPDQEYLRRELAGYGLAPTQAEGMIAAHYDADMILPQNLKHAAATFKIFSNCLSETA
jgi:hypothetical protein